MGLQFPALSPAGVPEKGADGGVGDGGGGGNQPEDPEPAHQDVDHASFLLHLNDDPAHPLNEMNYHKNNL